MTLLFTTVKLGPKTEEAAITANIQSIQNTPGRVPHNAAATLGRNLYPSFRWTAKVFHVSQKQKN